MNYKSETNKILINGNVTKKDVTDLTLLYYFRSGLNREDYWNLSHSKLQLEVVHYCMIVIYPSF